MAEVLRPFYHIFREFAGPIATIVAACVAAYYVRRQAKVSQSVALETLRFNLHEKRFAIYEGMREMIEVVLSQRNLNDWSLIT